MKKSSKQFQEMTHNELVEMIKELRIENKTLTQQVQSKHESLIDCGNKAVLFAKKYNLLKEYYTVENMK